jgi:hypothetical protein
MLKESAMAHFNLLYQHLSEGICNVKLGIVIKVKLSLALINHAIRSEGVGEWRYRSTIPDLSIT